MQQAEQTIYQQLLDAFGLIEITIGTFKFLAHRKRMFPLAKPVLICEVREKPVDGEGFFRLRTGSSYFRLTQEFGESIHLALDWEFSVEILKEWKPDELDLNWLDP